MPNAPEVRRAARSLRMRALATLATDPDLPMAADVAAAGLRLSNIAEFALDRRDPLLAGADGVLDRATRSVFRRSDMPAATRAYLLAHELAHLHLHSDDEASPTTARLYNDGHEAVERIVGYSPAQRREGEANGFAAELLAPLGIVGKMLCDGLGCGEIASRLGVSESVVLSQLTEALGASNAVDDAVQAAKPPKLPLEAASLDEDQDAAARFKKGPLLVEAGPGTGKTRTLIARIGVLIKAGTPPERILALTYSNKAANELRDRLAVLAPREANRIWTGTFHAFGLDLLRRFGSSIGLPLRPRLLDRALSIEMILDHLDRFSLDAYLHPHNPALGLADLLGAVSAAKDEMIGPGEFMALAAASMTDEVTSDPKAVELARFYGEWDNLLRDTGSLELADLIMRTAEMLETVPDVACRVQAEWPHILVDEYQDINRASARMLKALSGDGSGLWVVGDAAQAIYRFRGASPANVSEFERDYPSGSRILLRTNYRSRPAIVEAAERFSEASFGPRDAPWLSIRDDAPTTVEFVESETKSGQIAALAERIESAARQGVAFGSNAVLCRTNAQAQAIASELELEGIPTDLKERVFDSPAVRDLLSCIDIAAKDGSIGEARLGRTPLADVEANQNAGPKSAYDLSCEILFGELRRYAPASLAPASLLGMPAGRSVRELLRLARTHMEAHASDPDAASATLASNCSRFARFVQAACAAGIRTANDLDGPAPDAVRVMTVHAAKGLEFPYVYLPNLNKGLFPGKKPPSRVPDLIGVTSPEAEKIEESCLFFVGMTRAQERLVMLRHTRSGAKPAEPSFLWNAALGENAPTIVSEGPDTPLEVAETAAAPTASTGPWPISAVHRYPDCPRKFYYSQVNTPTEPTHQTSYRSLHRAVMDVLQEAYNALDTPDMCSLEAKLSEAMAPPVSAQDRVRVEHAKKLLRKGAELYSELSIKRSGVRHSAPWTGIAELTSGRVRVRVDRLLKLDDCSLEANVLKVGRLGDSAHTDPRYSVMRLALSQAIPEASSIRIIVRSLLTGESKEAPEKARYDLPRIDKINGILLRIAAKEFEPLPSDRECPYCPFFILCPNEPVTVGEADGQEEAE